MTPPPIAKITLNQRFIDKYNFKFDSRSSFPQEVILLDTLPLFINLELVVRLVMSTFF